MSVIVPCFNSAQVLPYTLEALFNQSLEKTQYEILLVDDGSTDGIESVLAARVPDGCKYYHQTNRGAAAARNFGARQAAGEIFVFLDSDVIPDSDFLQEHLRYHKQHSYSLAVGRTRALPAPPSNHFLSVLGNEIFAFDLGDQEQPITYLQVVSRNLSIRHEVYDLIGGFDEDFPRSGFEDTELAYRAVQLGLNLVYNPRAAGNHHHTGTLDEVAQHMYNYQTSAVLLMNKHPEIRSQIAHLRDKEPIQWRRDELQLVLRKLLRQMFALPLSIWLMRKMISGLEHWRPSPRLLHFMYWKILSSYLLLGFRRGMRRYGSPF